ncbi:hypothetical protein OUZ56_033131 [Daphnia magna]|uniref:Uncharacterized protein n=1 Tax=Daphnia magna TaxID=35525 RepID=A0ABR0BAB3_9CRUS|nr:hypothetical protein OUZ56_033131 [Daphnia magna]
MFHEAHRAEAAAPKVGIAKGGTGRLALGGDVEGGKVRRAHQTERFFGHFVASGDLSIAGLCQELTIKAVEELLARIEALGIDAGRIARISRKISAAWQHEGAVLDSQETGTEARSADRHKCGQAPFGSPSSVPTQPPKLGWVTVGFGEFLFFVLIRLWAVPSGPDFGSQVSMCEGPPFIQRRMTAFAGFFPAAAAPAWAERGRRSDAASAPREP